MATPLGVYLTDGVSSGGAGFWGLFLSGVTLGGLALAAQALVLSAGNFFARVNLQPVTALTQHLPQALQFWMAQMGASVAPTLAVLAILLVLLRSLPMAGTHAAEHQVVHCLERGMPLLPTCVRGMPRVHPRCGTNLVVGFILFQTTFLAAWIAAQGAGWAPLDRVTPALIVAAPLTLAYWRRAGGWVQQWLATKPATDRQIDGAIFAAKQVLQRREARSFQTDVRYRLVWRIWRMGMAQVLLGYALLYGLLLGAAHFWPNFGNLLGV
jgi:hypothetical protein